MMVGGREIAADVLEACVVILMGLEQAWHRGADPAKDILRFNAIDEERKRSGLVRHRTMMKNAGLSDCEVDGFTAWIVASGAEIPA